MQFMNASKQLSLSNSAYLNAVKRHVWQSYLDDLSLGDITTSAFIQKPSQIVTAKVISKDEGVLAGMNEAVWFLKEAGIDVIYSARDGEDIEKDMILLSLEGPAENILATERTLLNLLQRMSGVATKTAKLRSKLPKSVELLATRKTLWTDLDKRGVVVGGGLSHRLNLYDAVLVKDNHWKLSSDLEESWSHALKIADARFFEVEVNDLAQLDTFISVFKKTNKKVVVMLDNFKPSDIPKAVKKLKGLGIYIEVSGGIDEKNVGKYAVKGVDGVSSGAITMKAPALNISLDIL